MNLQEGIRNDYSLVNDYESGEERPAIAAPHPGRLVTPYSG